MKSILGVLSLLVALAIVALLAQKQLAATGQGRAPASLPAAASNPAPGLAEPAATVKQQSQNMQQQYRQAVEGALQAPRPMPDDDIQAK